MGYTMVMEGEFFMTKSAMIRARTEPDLKLEADTKFGGHNT